MTQNIIQLVHTIVQKERMPLALKLNQTPHDVIVAGVDTHISTYNTDEQTHNDIYDSNLDEEDSIQLEHIDLQPRQTYEYKNTVNEENIKDNENNTKDEEIDNEEILDKINKDNQAQELYLSEDVLSFSELERMQFLDDDQILSFKENEMEQENNIF